MVEFIAEIGWNFMGDMKLAETMVMDAKEAGADIAKFQYWNPEKLADGPWFDDGRIEIYKKAQLNEEKIKKLQAICASAKIGFLISAFNAEDAEFLKRIGVKKIKIPSHEVANWELHNFAARNFSKCYVSLGAGSWKELSQAIGIYNGSDTEWVGMHCVSSYPCPPEKVNLRKIELLCKDIETVGFSDHTTNIITPAIARALGAEVFEKHFTSDKSLPGRDNKFAVDKYEFQKMVEHIQVAEEMLTNLGPEAVDIEADTIANYRGRWG